MNTITTRSLREVNSRAGISAIEVLATIALLAALLAILLPAVQASRTSAARLSCLSRIRQVSLGLQNYEATYHTGPSSWHVPVSLASYTELILDDDATTGRHSLDSGYSSPDVWMCPVEVIPRDAGGFSYVPSNYLGYWTPFYGSFESWVAPVEAMLTSESVLDGASQTIVFAEQLHQWDNFDPDPFYVRS